MSDNYVCTSEASFLEGDATFTHTESYNATKHVSLGMHATTYHVADLPHNSRLLPNNTKTSKSCGSTVHRVDVTRDAYVSLTRQALQQHNTKHTSPDGDKTMRCALAQNHLIGINLGNPVVHTTILAADYHASAQEYFYRGPPQQLHTSATCLREHEDNVGLGTRPLHQPIEHQSLHPYPVFISLEDVNDQIGQSGFYVETVPVMQQLSQASTSHGNVLAGVGTQFSG
jgi:hypothetical protein